MNYDLLKAKMLLKHVDSIAVINALNISKSAFYRKMNGHTEFTRGELEKLVQILGLTAEEVNSIFFTDEVS